MANSTLLKNLFACGILSSISLNVMNGLYVNEIKQNYHKFEIMVMRFRVMQDNLKEIDEKLSKNRCVNKGNLYRLKYIDKERDPYEVNVNLLEKLEDILKEDVDIKESLKKFQNILNIEMIKADIDHLETLGYTKDDPKSFTNKITR